MKKCLIVLVFGMQLLSAQESQEPIFAPRPLLIFYDTVETTDLFLSCQPQVRAVLFEFISALIDKAAPILVTQSLFHNFLNRKILFHNLVTLPEAELKSWLLKESIQPCISASVAEQRRTSINLLAAYKKRTLSDAELKPVEFYTDLLVPYAIDFDTNGWLVIELAPFYLLLPRKQLKKWAPSFITSEYSKVESTLLPEETELGLKFQHFPVMTDNFLKTWQRVSVIQRPQLFINLLQKLFISNSAYQQIVTTGKQHQLPLWHCYLVGHGVRTGDLARLESTLQKDRAELTQIKDTLGQLKAFTYVTALRAIEQGFEYKFVPQMSEEISNQFHAGVVIAERIANKREGLLGKIAGLPIAYVTEMLRFFNDPVATRFLVLSSCFAAGENLLAPYSWEGKQVALNYTVVSHSLTEEPTTTFASKTELLKKIKMVQASGSKNIDVIGAKSPDGSAGPNIQYQNQYRAQYAVSPAFIPFFRILFESWSPPVGKSPKIIANPFVDAMAYVSGYFTSDGTIVPPSSTARNNLSWIRVPGTTWFSFAEFKDKTVMITPMLTARYEVEKKTEPLEIKNKALVLLATSHISVPLQISLYEKMVPELISIVPGVATHRFSKPVTMPVILKDFVEAILREQSTASTHTPTKYFYFEMLECLGLKQPVLIIKNKPVDGRFVNQVYQVVEDNAILFEQWIAGKSSFGHNKLDFIPKKQWLKLFDEFTTLEKSAREKFALTFTEYDALKQAYSAAQQGAQEAIKTAQFIDQYYKLRQKDAGEAAKYLKTLDARQQKIIENIFAASVPDVSGVADLSLRLQSLELS